MRVAAFTGSGNEPSARFRLRQYIPFLKNYDIWVTDIKSKLGSYPPSKKIVRPIWALGELVTRGINISRLPNTDVTFLQRELLSTYVTLESLTPKPRILDVDDAIWLHPRGDFVKKLTSLCDMVICGNEFIADYFLSLGSSVTVIPTAIDTDRFIPDYSRRPGRSDETIIGWSGTQSNLKFLYQIQDALKIICLRYPRVKIRVVSDIPPCFNEIDSSRVDYVKWTPLNEVAEIQSMDIGLMPLEDNGWSKGKCSFKMLLYLSCGVPVVVSPVGMNKKVIELGDFGYGASNIDEWVQTLDTMIHNKDKLSSMGDIGRNIISTQFSIYSVVPKLAEAIKSVAMVE